MRRWRLWRDRRGAAAAEMALVTPLLMTIMWGSIELGNYFMDEHVLIKAVRDGARYAARQPFTQYNGCTATPADAPTTLHDNVQTIVRKGSLDASAGDRLANWASAVTSVTVQMACTTTNGSQTYSGIYAGNSVGTANAGPVVIVSASVPYQPVIGYDLFGLGLTLRARQQAAVTGV